MRTVPVDLAELATFGNLHRAYQAARRGKRTRPDVLEFAYDVEAHLHALADEIVSGLYRPGPYRSFVVREPKRRVVSAAPFRDRIVHHLVTSVLEPVLDRRMTADTFANRPGKGTHRAIDRCQELARRASHYLKLDMVKYFPSIDHAILRRDLERVFRPGPFLDLIDTIIDSGAGVGYVIEEPWVFPGDEGRSDRPRGLPVGNLTSQWLANYYLSPIDHLVRRELRVCGYVRYMDDLILLAAGRDELIEVREALRKALAARRLRLHEDRAGVHPIRAGIPFLGMRIHPTHRVLLPRRARRAARRLARKKRLVAEGRLTAAELGQSVRSWAAHAAGADSHRLRRRVLGRGEWIRKNAKNA